MVGDCRFHHVVLFLKNASFLGFWGILWVSKSVCFCKLLTDSCRCCQVMAVGWSWMDFLPCPNLVHRKNGLGDVHNGMNLVVEKSMLSVQDGLAFFEEQNCVCDRGKHKYLKRVFVVIFHRCSCDHPGWAFESSGWGGGLYELLGLGPRPRMALLTNSCLAFVWKGTCQWMFLFNLLNHRQFWCLLLYKPAFIWKVHVCKHVHIKRTATLQQGCLWSISTGCCQRTPNVIGILKQFDTQVRANMTLKKRTLRHIRICTILYPDVVTKMHVSSFDIHFGIW